MAKNVDGLWATIGTSADDKNRRTGKLIPERKLSIEGRRVLEVLYCECCGTQLLCGNKVPLREGPLGQEKYELTSLEAQIEGLPETTVESRTDAQSYREVGVVWLSAGESAPRAAADLCWKQGTIAMTMVRGRPRAPEDRKQACWEPASIDPNSGIVVPGRGGDGIPCYW